jgi:cell division protease FtsH
VAGIDEAKEELQEVVEFLKHSGKISETGGQNTQRGASGRPAGNRQNPSGPGRGRGGQSAFLQHQRVRVCGDVCRRWSGPRSRSFFAGCGNQAPCIIFIDELDALGKARGMNVMGGHDEREQTLNQLLVEMDGFETNKGVIIMAATNRPEILDPALLRPGRLDRQVLVDRPDINGREAILKIHSKNVVLGPEVDLRKIAGRTRVLWVQTWPTSSMKPHAGGPQR